MKQEKIEVEISLAGVDVILDTAKQIFFDIQVADNSCYDGFVITGDKAIKIDSYKETDYILIVPTENETNFLLVLTNNEEDIASYFGDTSFTDFWEIA